MHPIIVEVQSRTLASLTIWQPAGGHMDPDLLDKAFTNLQFQSKKCNKPGCI